MIFLLNKESNQIINAEILHAAWTISVSLQRSFDASIPKPMTTRQDSTKMISVIVRIVADDACQNVT